VLWCSLIARPVSAFAISGSTFARLSMPLNVRRKPCGVNRSLIPAALRHVFHAFAMLFAPRSLPVRTAGNTQPALRPRSLSLQ